MEAFGAPDDVIQQARREQEAEDAFEIHADNAEIVLAFLSLQTQWRIIAGLGAAVYQGLDYASVRAALPMLGIKASDRNAMFEGLRLMERAAVPILNMGADDVEPPEDDDG